MAVPVPEVRRVVLLGAESTGTTTLTQDVGRILGAPSTYEALRDVCERKAAENGGSFFDVVWLPEDFDETADRQDELERRAAAEWTAGRGQPGAPDLGPFVVCDTDALAVALWQRRYLGSTPAHLLERAAARPPLLYVLTSPEGVAFVQDGWRDGEHVRLEMHDWFREALDGQPVPWIEVSGSPEARVERVLDELTTLGAAQPA
jgi:nicotinamide riboside kinase